MAGIDRAFWRVKKEANPLFLELKRIKSNGMPDAFISYSLKIELSFI